MNIIKIEDSFWKKQLENDKDYGYIIEIEPNVIPKCKCNYPLGKYLEDGGVEIFKNIYENLPILKMYNPYNYILRCPACGQLLGWEDKSDMEENEYV